MIVRLVFHSRTFGKWIQILPKLQLISISGLQKVTSVSKEFEPIRFSLRAEALLCCHSASSILAEMKLCSFFE